MQVTAAQRHRIRALLNKVDLMCLIEIGAPADEYDSELDLLLERLDQPEPAQVEKILLEVFTELFGEEPPAFKKQHIPKLSSDICRVLALQEIKEISKITVLFQKSTDAEEALYTEEIIIDADCEEITYIRNWGAGRRIANNWFIPFYASSFIDEYSLLFQDFGIDQSRYDGQAPTVEITVFYTDQTFFRIIRSYNRYGLPPEWKEFIDDLGTLLFSYRLFGAVFDENVYGKGRMENEYIFLSVVFGGYGKEYYYLTEDDSIETGDSVLVPVGDQGTRRIVRVVKKEYFKEADVPMPLEQVKHIIGKHTEELDEDE